MANVFDIFSKKSRRSTEVSENEQMNRFSPKTTSAGDSLQTQGVNNDSPFQNKDGAKASGNYAYGADSRQDTQEAGSPFTIPKLKRSKQDLFVEMPTESREWQQEVLPLLTKYFRFPLSAAKFEFFKVSMIQNAERSQKYLDKKKEMRQQGYSERDVAESFAFLYMDDDKQAERICRDGLGIGNLISSTIGHPRMGVQLCKYMDTVRSANFTSGSTGKLIVFKVMKGRVKVVAENRTGPPLEPTPNYDSHMAKSSLDITPASHQQLYELYQIYLYEYGEELTVEPYPRHVLPYAVVNFRYKEAPPSPRMPESPPVFSPRLMSPPIPKFTLSTPKEDIDPEYVIWCGNLRVKDILDCQVKMVSTAFQYKPAHLGTVLNVRDTVEMKAAEDRYFKELSCLRKSGEVYWKGWYINVAELRPRPDSKSQFQRLMNHLGRTNSMAVLKPENDVILLLVPNCSLTHDLGLTRPHHYPVMFHCIFISKQSVKFKSPRYMQKVLFHQTSGSSTPKLDSGQLSPLTINVNTAGRSSTAPASPSHFLSPRPGMDRSASFGNLPRDEETVWKGVDEKGDVKLKEDGGETREESCDGNEEKGVDKLNVEVGASGRLPACSSLLPPGPATCTSHSHSAFPAFSGSLSGTGVVSAPSFLSTPSSSLLSSLGVSSASPVPYPRLSPIQASSYPFFPHSCPRLVLSPRSSLYPTPPLLSPGSLRSPEIAAETSESQKESKNLSETRTSKPLQIPKLVLPEQQPLDTVASRIGPYSPISPAISTSQLLYSPISPVEGHLTLGPYSPISPASPRSQDAHSAGMHSSYLPISPLTIASSGPYSPISPAADAKPTGHESKAGPAYSYFSHSISRWPQFASPPILSLGVPSITTTSSHLLSVGGPSSTYSSLLSVSGLSTSALGTRDKHQSSSSDTNARLSGAVGGGDGSSDSDTQLAPREGSNVLSAGRSSALPSPNAEGNVPSNEAQNLMRLHRSLSMDWTSSESPSKSIPLGYDEGFLTNMPVSAHVDPLRLKTAFEIQHQIQDALSPGDPLQCDLPGSGIPVLMSPSPFFRRQDDVEQDDTITSSTSHDPSTIPSALRHRSLSTEASFSPVPSPDKTPSEPEAEVEDLRSPSAPPSPFLAVPKESHARVRSLYLPPPNIPEYKPTPLYEPSPKRSRLEEGSRQSSTSSSVLSSERGAAPAARNTSSVSGLYRTSTPKVPTVGVTHVRSPRDLPLPLPVSPADSSTDRVKSPPASENISTANDMKNFLNASLERKPPSKPPATLSRSCSAFPANTSISDVHLSDIHSPPCALFHHCSNHSATMASSQNEGHSGITTASNTDSTTHSTHVPSIIVSIPLSRLHYRPSAKQLNKRLLWPLKRLHNGNIPDTGRKAKTRAHACKASVVVQLHPSALLRPPHPSPVRCSLLLARERGRHRSDICTSQPTQSNGEAVGEIVHSDCPELGKSSHYSCMLPFSSNSHAHCDSSQSVHLHHAQPAPGILEDTHHHHHPELMLTQEQRIWSSSEQNCSHHHHHLHSELDDQQDSETNVFAQTETHSSGHHHLLDHEMSKPQQIGSPLLGSLSIASQENRSSSETAGSLYEPELQHDFSIPLDVLELVRRLKAVAKERMIEEAVTKLMGCKAENTQTDDNEDSSMEDHSDCLHLSASCGTGAQVEEEQECEVGTEPERHSVLEHTHYWPASNDPELELELRACGLDCKPVIMKPVQLEENRSYHSSGFHTQQSSSDAYQAETDIDMSMELSPIPLPISCKCEPNILSEPDHEPSFTASGEAGQPFKSFKRVKPVKLKRKAGSTRKFKVVMDPYCSDFVAHDSSSAEEQAKQTRKKLKIIRKPKKTHFSRKAFKLNKQTSARKTVEEQTIKSKKSILSKLDQIGEKEELSQFNTMPGNPHWQGSELTNVSVMMMLKANLADTSESGRGCPALASSDLDAGELSPDISCPGVLVGDQDLFDSDTLVEQIDQLLSGGNSPTQIEAGCVGTINQEKPEVASGPVSTGPVHLGDTLPKMVTQVVTKPEASRTTGNCEAGFSSSTKGKSVSHGKKAVKKTKPADVSESGHSDSKVAPFCEEKILDGTACNHPKSIKPASGEFHSKKESPKTVFTKSQIKALQRFQNVHAHLLKPCSVTVHHLSKTGLQFDSQGSCKIKNVKNLTVPCSKGAAQTTHARKHEDNVKKTSAKASEKSKSSAISSRASDSRSSGDKSDDSPLGRSQPLEGQNPHTANAIITTDPEADLSGGTKHADSKQLGSDSHQTSPAKAKHQLPFKKDTSTSSCNSASRHSKQVKPVGSAKLSKVRPSSQKKHRIAVDKGKTKASAKSSSHGQAKRPIVQHSHSWDDVLQEMTMLSGSSCSSKTTAEPSKLSLPRIPKRNKPSNSGAVGTSRKSSSGVTTDSKNREHETKRPTCLPNVSSSKPLQQTSPEKDRPVHPDQKANTDAVSVNNSEALAVGSSGGAHKIPTLSSSIRMASESRKNPISVTQELPGKGLSPISYSSANSDSSSSVLPQQSNDWQDLSTSPMMNAPHLTQHIALMQQAIQSVALSLTNEQTASSAVFTGPEPWSLTHPQTHSSPSVPSTDTRKRQVMACLEDAGVAQPIQPTALSAGLEASSFQVSCVPAETVDAAGKCETQVADESPEKSETFRLHFSQAHKNAALKASKGTKHSHGLSTSELPQMSPRNIEKLTEHAQLSGEHSTGTPELHSQQNFELAEEALQENHVELVKDHEGDRVFDKAGDIKSGKKTPEHVAEMTSNEGNIELKVDLCEWNQLMSTYETKDDGMLNEIENSLPKLPQDHKLITSTLHEFHADEECSRSPVLTCGPSLTHSQRESDGEEGNHKGTDGATTTDHEEKRYGPATPPYLCQEQRYKPANQMYLSQEKRYGPHLSDVKRYGPATPSCFAQEKRFSPAIPSKLSDHKKHEKSFDTGTTNDFAVLDECGYSDTSANLSVSDVIFHHLNLESKFAREKARMSASSGQLLTVKSAEEKTVKTTNPDHPLTGKREASKEDTVDLFESTFDSSEGTKAPSSKTCLKSRPHIAPNFYSFFAHTMVKVHESNKKIDSELRKRQAGRGLSQRSRSPSMCRQGGGSRSPRRRNRSRSPSVRSRRGSRSPHALKRVRSKTPGQRSRSPSEQPIGARSRTKLRSKSPSFKKQRSRSPDGRRGRSRSPSAYSTISRANSPSRREDYGRDERMLPARGRDRGQVTEDRHRRQYQPYGDRQTRGNERDQRRKGKTGDRWNRRCEEDKPIADFALAYKAKRKAEKEAEAHLTAAEPPPSMPRQTRAAVHRDDNAIKAQRTKWAADKRAQRATWNGNKWQWHRMKNLAAYHARRRDASSSTFDNNAEGPDQPQLNRSPVPNTCQATPARPSLDKETPESKRVKTAVYRKLQDLKSRRDKKSLAHRKLLMETVSPVSNHHQRKHSPYKRKKMNENTAAAVAFLENVAIDMPGKKTVSKRDLQQKKVLPKRMKRLHRDFSLQQGTEKVSLRTMYRHLPRHVKTVKHQGYRQCLCEICVNIDLKLDTLNACLSKAIDGRDVAGEHTLCQKPTLQCYDRKCASCGVRLLQEIIHTRLTAEPTTEVRWLVWKLVKREKGSRVEKVPETTTLSRLVEELLHGLELFCKHVFTHRFQHMQYKLLLSKLPVLEDLRAVVVADFAENYLCKHQNEVQSAHWGYNQVTVHPTVLTYPCADCRSLVTEYIVFLSDDLLHDAHMVKTIFKRTTDRLQSLGIKKSVFWSDGCAAHYKSKLPFFQASEMTDMERAFFGSRHGKSPCDACGGVTKAIVDHDVLSGEVAIQNAQQMCEHLTAHYTLPVDGPSTGECCHTKRTYQLISTEEIDRSMPSSAVHVIPGTRQIHHLKGLRKGVVASRKLACFCDSCLNLADGECDYKEFVQQWEVTKMKVSPQYMKDPPSPPPQSSPSPPPQSSPSPPPQSSPSPPPQSSPSPPPQSSPSPPPQSSPSPPPQSSPSPQPPPSLQASHMPSANQPSDLPPSPPLPHMRAPFFSSLQDRMCEASSFHELNTVCQQYLPQLDNFELPTSDSQRFITSTPGVTVDKLSLSLLTSSAPDRYFPVTTRGDGNCFPRALSLLLFGSQTFHVELQVRIILEMTQNLDMYLDPDFLSLGTQDDGRQLLALLVKYADIPYDAAKSAKEVLQEEVFRVRELSTECGMWHLFAAANIMGTTIQSVFPDKGPVEMQMLARRLVHPARHQQGGRDFCLMWTTHRQDQADAYWAPTHFVPLLALHPLSPSIEEEEEDEDPCNIAFIERELGELLTDKTSMTFHNRLSEERKKPAALFKDRCYKGKRFAGYRFRRSRIPTLDEFQLLAEIEGRNVLEKPASDAEEEPENEKEDDKERSMLADTLDKVLGETEEPCPEEGMERNLIEDLRVKSGNPLFASSFIGDEVRGSPLPSFGNMSPSKHLHAETGSHTSNEPGESLSSDSVRTASDTRRVVSSQSVDEEFGRKSISQPSVVQALFPDSDQTSEHRRRKIVLKKHSRLKSKLVEEFGQQRLPLNDHSQVGRRHQRSSSEPGVDESDTFEAKSYGQQGRSRHRSAASTQLKHMLPRGPQTPPEPYPESSPVYLSPDVLRCLQPGSRQNSWGSQQRSCGPHTPPEPSPSLDLENTRSRGLSVCSPGLRDPRLSVQHGCVGPTTPPLPCTDSDSSMTADDDNRSSRVYQDSRTGRLVTLKPPGRMFVSPSDHSPKAGGITELPSCSLDSLKLRKGTASLEEDAVKLKTVGEPQPRIAADKDAEYGPNTVLKIINTAKRTAAAKQSYQPLVDSVSSSATSYMMTNLTKTAASHPRLLPLNSGPAPPSQLTVATASIPRQSAPTKTGQSSSTATSDQPVAIQNATQSMERLVHQLKVLIDQKAGRTSSDAATKPTLAKDRSRVPQPSAAPAPRRKKKREISKAPWVLHYWPGRPVPITLAQRIPDYQPNPSLADERHALQVDKDGPDPRLDPDRPSFVPGGKSEQAKALVLKEKKRLFSCIKVVKEIPLEPVMLEGRSLPKDPRHPFRSVVADMDELGHTEKDDGEEHLNMAAEVDNLEGKRATKKQQKQARVKKVTDGSGKRIFSDQEAEAALSGHTASEASAAVEGKCVKVVLELEEERGLSTVPWTTSVGSRESDVIGSDASGKVFSKAIDIIIDKQEVASDTPGSTSVRNAKTESVISTSGDDSKESTCLRLELTGKLRPDTGELIQDKDTHASEDDPCDMDITPEVVQGMRKKAEGIRTDGGARENPEYEHEESRETATLDPMQNPPFCSSMDNSLSHRRDTLNEELFNHVMLMGSGGSDESNREDTEAEECASVKAGSSQPPVPKPIILPSFSEVLGTSSKDLFSAGLHGSSEKLSQGKSGAPLVSRSVQSVVEAISPMKHSRQKQSLLNPPEDGCKVGETADVDSEKGPGEETVCLSQAPLNFKRENEAEQTQEPTKQVAHSNQADLNSEQVDREIIHGAEQVSESAKQIVLPGQEQKKEDSLVTIQKAGQVKEATEQNDIISETATHTEHKKGPVQDDPDTNQTREATSLTVLPEDEMYSSEREEKDFQNPLEEKPLQGDSPQKATEQTDLTSPAVLNVSQEEVDLAIQLEAKEMQEPLTHEAVERSAVSEPTVLNHDRDDLCVVQEAKQMQEQLTREGAEQGTLPTALNPDHSDSLVGQEAKEWQDTNTMPTALNPDHSDSRVGQEAKEWQDTNTQTGLTHSATLNSDVQKENQEAVLETAEQRSWTRLAALNLKQDRSDQRVTRESPVQETESRVVVLCHTPLSAGLVNYSLSSASDTSFEYNNCSISFTNDHISDNHKDMQIFTEAAAESTSFDKAETERGASHTLTGSPDQVRTLAGSADRKPASSDSHLVIETAQSKSAPKTSIPTVISPCEAESDSHPMQISAVASSYRTVQPAKAEARNALNAQPAARRLGSLFPTNVSLNKTKRDSHPMHISTVVSSHTTGPHGNSEMRDALNAQPGVGNQQQSSSMRNQQAPAALVDATGDAPCPHTAFLNPGIDRPYHRNLRGQPHSRTRPLRPQVRMPQSSNRFIFNNPPGHQLSRSHGPPRYDLQRLQAPPVIYRNSPVRGRFRGAAPMSRGGGEELVQFPSPHNLYQMGSRQRLSESRPRGFNGPFPRPWRPRCHSDPYSWVGETCYADFSSENI